MDQLSQDQTSSQMNEAISSDQPDWSAIEQSINDGSENFEELPNEADAVGSGVLTPDEFYAGFKGMFDICGVIPFEPFPLRSMTIKGDEEPQARACADAIYEIAEETPWLRFLLEPQGKWVPRLMAIGMFAGGKVVAVRTELVGKMQPQQPAEPENQVVDLGVFASE